MKKAKEYAEQLKDAEKLSGQEFAKLIHGMLIEFFDESKELSEKRGHTDKALMGILNELDNKWKSIASKTEVINGNGFRNFLIKEIPEIKQLMKW